MSRPVQPDTVAVDDLAISNRTRLACLRGSLFTVGDIRRLGRDNLARVPCIGRAAIGEIEAAIGTWAVGRHGEVFLAGVATSDLVAELARRFAATAG